jgi:membrane-associated phospholipid phosphatase
MRASEWICLLFLSLFILLGVIRPLDLRKRFRVIGLGLAGILLITAATIYSVIRDWVPSLILLLVYWQGGSFFSQPHEKLQAFLLRMDQLFLAKLHGFNDKHSAKGGHFNLYWEVAYFFCYPLVPGAIAVLYVLKLRSGVDFFWTVVLPPTLLCHLIVSFYQTYPPWKFLNQESRGTIRRLNFLVIRHASIQLNTFPSAHVAASMAVAFAMLFLHPLTGAIFLLLAISITAATVIGRYHYAADAVLGFLLALGWYAIAALL